MIRLYLLNVSKCILSYLSVYLLKQDCVSKNMYSKEVLLCSRLVLYNLNTAKKKKKNGIGHNAQITGLIHAHCQAFLQHKTASALQLTFNIFLCLEVWALCCIYILHRSQMGATLSQVALPRTGAEYSHDLFWKQSVQDKLRNSV